MANLASRLYPPCLRAYRRSLKRFGPIHAFCYALGNGLLSVVSPAIGFRTNSDDPLWWRLSLTTGSHEAATRQTFAKIVRPGMTVVDVGAHIGYYTTQFAQLVGASGRVIAFEPQPRNHDILRHNVSGKSNVTLLEKAASDRDGTVSLFDDTPDTGGASLRRDSDRMNLHRSFTSAEDLAPRAWKGSPGGEIPVAAVRIDETLASLGVHSVDIVKMDIEGAEMGALLGMEGVLANSARLDIVLELNPVALRPFGVEPARLCAWLTERGFRLSRIVDDGGLVELVDEAAALDLIAELDSAESHANLLASRR